MKQRKVLCPGFLQLLLVCLEGKALYKAVQASASGVQGCVCGGGGVEQALYKPQKGEGNRLSFHCGCIEDQLRLLARPPLWSRLMLPLVHGRLVPTLPHHLLPPCCR